MNAQRASGSSRLCVVLACFPERKDARRARHRLANALHADGATVVDDVIVVVNGKGRARVHDPSRVLAGILTAALTWGLFGLCSGGGIGLLVWGVLGAICGGGYAYFAEHVLTKNQLQLVGGHLPASSSAIVAFAEAADRDAVLAQAAKVSTVVSVVAISPELAASGVAPTGPRAEDGHAVLTMLLVRFAGEHGAASALSSPKRDSAEVELVFEVPRHGRTRVISPSAGVAAWAKSDVISWGAFGVAFGLVVGFVGNGGTFGILEEGAVKGVLWGVFGLGAGALYGLWVGRAVSARRIKGLQALLPPDTATALVWLTAGARDGEITRETRASTAHVAIDFLPVEGGAVLQAS
jgi:uncharacterized membrane protein